VSVVSVELVGAKSELRMGDTWRLETAYGRTIHGSLGPQSPLRRRTPNAERRTPNAERWTVDAER